MSRCRSVSLFLFIKLDGLQMKIPFNLLSMSAGKIDDGGLLYASVQVLDESKADQITQDRIDVGQKTAKIKVFTGTDNRLAMDLAKSSLIPGIVTCEVETIVKKGEMVMQIIGFSNKAAI